MDAGVDTGAEADSMFFAGEAVADLFSACFGDFFFFRITSIHLFSTFFGWA